MKRLDAVVFDVGNVLFEWHPRHLYARLIDDEARLDWFLDNVVTLDWHFQLDAGRSFAECAAELSALYPAEKLLIDAWQTRFNETLEHPVEGMFNIVRRLREAGVPLFAITNFSADLWPPFRKTQPIFDCFEDILVSGVEQIAKPDDAIYQLATKRFGIEPQQALFIDDRADNVEASILAGYQGHVFKNAGQLEIELIRHGLLSA